MTSTTKARDAWNAEMIRLYGEIMTNPVAYAVMNLAIRVFEEYDKQLAVSED